MFSRFLMHFFIHMVFFAGLITQSIFYGNELFQYSFLVLVTYHLKIFLKQLQTFHRKDSRRNYCLRALENFTMASSYMVIGVWLMKLNQNFSAFYMIIGPGLATIFNFFQSGKNDHERSQIDNVYIICTRVVIVLRFIIGICITIKIEDCTSWDWRTTFWAFWCSLAIQAIVLVALCIIFVQTLCHWIGKPSKYFIDCVSCLWTTLVFFGYSFALL